MLSISITRPIRRLLTVVGILLLGGATVVSIHSIERQTTASTVVVSKEIAPTNNLEAVRITVRPWGFEPEMVTRPAGRFLLAVNDRTGKRDLSLILLRASGERVKEIRLRETPRKYEWREIVTLPPGQYLLVDGTNREHACRIVLTN